MPMLDLKMTNQISFFFFQYATVQRLVVSAYSIVQYSNCNTLTISLLLFFRFRTRGRAQADDEDSMDTTDITPTPDIDITEIGENYLCKLLPGFELLDLYTNCLWCIIYVGCKHKLISCYSWWMSPLVKSVPAHCSSESCVVLM